MRFRGQEITIILAKNCFPVEVTTTMQVLIKWTCLICLVDLVAVQFRQSWLVVQPATNYFQEHDSPPNGQGKTDDFDAITTTRHGPFSATKEAAISLFKALPPISTAGGRLAKPLVLTNCIRRSNSLIEHRDEVVAVTQMGVTKADILLVLLEHWNGPASVAIYIKDEGNIEQFFAFVQGHGPALVNTTFHLVMEKPDSFAVLDTPSYPHNELRNVALQTVESDFVVLLDVDFIPSPNMHDQLLSWIQSPKMDLKKKASQERTIFVIPAFELFPTGDATHADPHMLPRSPRQVVDMFRNESLGPFKKGHLLGHNATNFSKWLELNNASSTTKNGDYTYPITIEGRWMRKFWEPYVFAYRPILPRYWEGFRGYGYNKISFFFELLDPKYGISWEAFRDLYCVHVNHPAFDKKTRVRSEGDNGQVYELFRKYLRAKYGKIKKTNK